MRKIIILFVVLIFSFGCVFANEHKEDKFVSKETKYKKSDRKRYRKYVSRPLKEFSSEIISGTLDFQMSLWMNSEEKSRIYNCTLEFSRFPAVGSALPSMVFTVGDSLRYVTSGDSLYIYDLATGVHTVDSFKTAMNTLIFGNQFLSFYAYWYSLCGEVVNMSVIKKGEFISSEFEVLPADETQYCITGAGNYQFVYHAESGLLHQYCYRPADIWKEKYGYEKIECELINYKSGNASYALLDTKKNSRSFLDSEIQMYILYYCKGLGTYKKMIDCCNGSIDLFNNRSSLFISDERFPDLQ